MIINYLVSGSVLGRCAARQSKKKSSEDETRKKKRRKLWKKCSQTFSLLIPTQVVSLRNWRGFRFLTFLRSPLLLGSIFHVKRSVPSIVFNLNHRRPSKRRCWREKFQFFHILYWRFMARREKGNFSSSAHCECAIKTKFLPPETCAYISLIKLRKLACRFFSMRLDHTANKTFGRWSMWASSRSLCSVENLHHFPGKHLIGRFQTKNDKHRKVRMKIACGRQHD